MEMKRERMRYMRPAAVWLLGTAMLALAGCVKRDLEIRPDEGCVEIVLDWAKAGGSSRSARLLFYNESGTLVKEVSGVTDCFKGTFPLGNYRLLVHNTDAVRVDWRGTERYESAEVFALPAQYGTDYHPGEGVPCISEPREIFAAGRCNESETVEVRQIETTRVSVSPVELTRRVVFHFTVVTDDGESIRSLRGVLDGVSPGYFPGQGCHEASSSCAVEFTAVPEMKSPEAAYAAQVNVFGLLTTPQSPAGTNNVHVALDLTDGTQLTGTFDITSTIRQILASEGGTLPREIPLDVTFYVRATGLNATVEPWDESGEGSGEPRPQA